MIVVIGVVLEMMKLKLDIKYKIVKFSLKYS